MTKPPQGKKIDFNSNTVKAYRAQLAALRNAYKAWLKANVPAAKVTGEFDIALNAVAVQLGGATLAQISATSMVVTAEYQGLYYPSATDPDTRTITNWNAAVMARITNDHLIAQMPRCELVSEGSMTP